ncbi:MAG: aminopeptidase, partial [Planctomycetes bacterium]|nr:aminopeptidase [Planctomycetota bacterium]
KAMSFSVAWSFSLVDLKKIRARSGQEVLDDGNAIYSVAQWYPRMCAYTDVHGWRHRQYIGGGEFTLEFGSFLVKITVPDDHIVASTGTLQNPDEVLTAEPRARLARAAGAKKPVLVVTKEEAGENRKERGKGQQSRIFHADMVRDFAFASSRSFAWDAMSSSGEGFSALCMSFYPSEAMPLWNQYATHATAQTIEVYSKFTVPYPWPVANSVNSPVGGMEYPMIHFTGARPEKDGTYSESKKYGMISVIIHEVGHNFFPMVINSDEREWIWMDEGFNTFVQQLAEQEWSQDYPSRRGIPRSIGSYMKSSNQVPIMTRAASLVQSRANAYSKTAAGLTILRETIMGRETFDFAVKEYARLWKFKRTMPADFLRTMEV